MFGTAAVIILIINWAVLNIDETYSNKTASHLYPAYLWRDGPDGSSQHRQGTKETRIGT